MKIVVITHNYIRRQGDITALYLHRLCAGLVRKGLQLTVVCPHAPGLMREETIDGVKIERFGYALSGVKPIVYTGTMHQEVAGSWKAKIVFISFLRSFYRHALETCRRERPDLTWANWWTPPGIIAARIARKLRLPLVISSHGTDISLLRKSRIISRAGRYVYARAVKATVVSSFLKQMLIEHVASIDPDDISVIPMPVGMEHFPKTPPPQNRIPVLLSVARYTRQKRLDDIIHAAARVRAAGTPVKLLMVGEGPLEGELKELAAQTAPTEMIEFIPLMTQEKLGELYRRSDAVVLASEGEGFGLVLVEAGLTGRPVIGARSGGITDIIIDGENGLLYEVGQVADLAERIRILLTDEGKRKTLGEGGYQRALKHFSTPVLVDRMYDLFMSVMSDKRRT